MGFKARRGGLLPFVSARRAGFLDHSGRVVIAARFNSAQPFAGGMAAVKEARWGYLDASGLLAVPCTFQLADSFSPDGVAVVHKKVGGKNQVFHIDREGARLCDEVSLNAGPFQDGLGRTMAASGQWQFIDRNGAIALGPLAGDVGDFSDGLAPFAPRIGGSWGYIDRAGHVAIEPGFRDVGAFVDGVAPAISKDTLSFIDRQGRTVATTKERVRSFGRISGGLLRVSMASGSSWLDLEGRVVIAGPYAVASDFTPGGVAMAGTATDRRGVIDRGGAWVLEPRYWGMGAITDGFAMVYPSGKQPSMYAWVRLSDQKVIWKPESLDLRA